MADLTTILVTHLAAIRATKGGASLDTSTAMAKDATAVRGSLQARLVDYNTDLRDYIVANG